MNDKELRILARQLVDRSYDDLPDAWYAIEAVVDAEDDYNDLEDERNDVINEVTRSIMDYYEAEVTEDDYDVVLDNVQYFVDENARGLNTPMMVLLDDV